MNTNQKNLQITREYAIRLGKEALEIQRNGYYFTAGGERHDISKDVLLSMTGTKTYAPGKPLPISLTGQNDTTISVVNTTTFSAAKTLIKAGYRPAALNMASSTDPGGGFLEGGRAQEEYLCRSSALYFCLAGNQMYLEETFHTNPFYDDYVIYSPDVIVFREDDGALLEQPYHCSIITSPAVHAHAVNYYMPQRSGEIESMMWNRILKVLAVGANHNHDSLVLGAWGCGAFGNDGYMVSNLFKIALEENFRGAFSHVVFAITDWSPERKFIWPFMQAFGIK